VPIRLRLAGLFALGTAAAVALASIVFVHFLAAGLRSSLDASLRSRADLIAQTFTTRTVPGVTAGLVPTIRGQGEGIAQIFGPSGQLAAYSTGAGDIALIPPDQLARARQGVVTFSTVVGGGAQQQGDNGDSSHAGEHVRILAAPLARTGGAWVIVVASSLDTSDNALARVTHAAALGALPAVALAAAAAWLLASAALRPVERMRRQVADITSHDPATGVQVPATRDEIAALARTMNDLLTRLGDALARERSFVADAGHELRTPLAILRTELELASRPGRTRAELASAVAAAAEETDRLARLAEDLLLLARSDSGATLRRDPTRLAPLLTTALDRVRARADADHVALVLEAPTELEAEIDPGRVRQAVDNLLDNALRHAPAASAVTVGATRDGPNVVIEVSDQGPGFPPSFLAHAFERFRRADTARASQDGGAGLGLAIVQSIAHAHGGQVSAGNRPEGGAWIRLELPAAAPTSADTT